MTEMTVDEFITGWKESSLEAKQFFLSVKETVTALADVECSFTARPGVSFSLRPKRAQQSGRSFFAIIDIIDDEPEDRWLSVCFYADLITDPEEKGSLIPGGLAEGDGYCFDVFTFEAEELQYITDRLKEAWSNCV